MKKVYLLVVLLSSFVGYTQIALNPVEWVVSYNSISNTEGELIFTANIQDRWHIYSQKPSTDGPVPTSFSITLNNNHYELVGAVEESNAHEIFDITFDAKLFVFDKQAVFKQKIKRKTKKAFHIISSVEFMSCDDSKCLPPKTLNFETHIPEITVLKSKL